MCAWHSQVKCQPHMRFSESSKWLGPQLVVTNLSACAHACFAHPRRCSHFLHNVQNACYLLGAQVEIMEDAPQHQSVACRVRPSHKSFVFWMPAYVFDDPDWANKPYPYLYRRGAKGLTERDAGGYDKSQGNLFAQMEPRLFFNAPRFAGVPHRIEDQESHMPDAKDKPCTTYKGTLECFIEYDEWIMADAFVNPSHTIIEFGARYGTTSCRLARLTNNSGNVVSVDPDRQSTKFLLANRETHRCNFHAISGTVSATPQRIRARQGYATRTDPIELTGGRAGPEEGGIRKLPNLGILPNFGFREVEEHIDSLIMIASLIMSASLTMIASLIRSRSTLAPRLMRSSSTAKGAYGRCSRSQAFSRSWNLS